MSEIIKLDNQDTIDETLTVLKILENQIDKIKYVMMRKAQVNKSDFEVIQHMVSGYLGDK